MECLGFLVLPLGFEVDMDTDTMYRDFPYPFLNTCSLWVWGKTGCTFVGQAYLVRKWRSGQPKGQAPGVAAGRGKMGTWEVCVDFGSV